ncbi:MAG: carboxypeptidase-like regulatory domain-containing protein [Daejeonella sp.]
MKRILLFCFMLLAVLTTRAQYKFSGKVIAEVTGAALPGATVRFKNTTVATITGNDGLFYLEAAQRAAILEVSFVGYTSQQVTLTLPLTENLVIVLKTLENVLEEVTVSTGYQDLPKERTTGSFEVIDKRLFNEQASTTVLGRLEAVANGLIVDRVTNAAGRIMIRGLSTIRGPKEPLIVLDNFPYEGSLDNINPNDVENITILKDATAASIWGTRAGNGVIVITTKKGRLNQPLTIDFNSNVTVQDKPNLDYSPQMASSDFIDVEQFLFSKGYYTSQISSPSRPVLSPVVELLIRRASGNAATQAQIDAEINSLRDIDVRNDFDRYLYTQGINQQYALGVRGGSNTMSWNMSAGYDRNSSVLSADYSRLNIRLQNTARLVKALELNTSLYYTLSGNTNGKPRLRTD